MRPPRAPAEAIATRAGSGGAGASSSCGGEAWVLESQPSSLNETREDDRCHPPSLRATAPALAKQALELRLDRGQYAACRLPLEDLVDPLVDHLRAGVVLALQELRRARDARNARDRRLQVRVRLDDGLVLRNGRAGGHERVRNRVVPVDTSAGRVADELDRGGLVLRVLRHGELPAADRPYGSALRAVREHGDVELALDLRVRARS